MYGIISSDDYFKEIQDAVENQNVWFEKNGYFTPELFLQHCQSAANANIQTLIVDMNCTDDSSIIRGIQQYRLLRDSRIIILAPDRIPGDTTITTLIGLQVLDIIAPSVSEDSGNEGEYVRPSITPQIKQQIAMKPSYGNAVRWDLKTADMAQKKQFNYEMVNQKNIKVKQVREIDPVLMQHIESLQLQPIPVKEKLTLVETIIGSVIIAVVGVENIASTTHTAILITNYLSRKGRKVAIIEANENEDFEKIEYFYEGLNGSESTDQIFSIEGVDYYKSSYKYDIAELLEMKYDYIILDLGSYKKCDYMDEFFRAHVQVISGHGIEWRQKKLIDFSSEYEHRDQSKWIYCVPHAEKIVIEDIRKELPNANLYAIPSHPDPFRAQKDTDTILETFLNEYLGQKRRHSKSGILSIGLGIALTTIIILIILLVRK